MAARRPKRSPPMPSSGAPMRMPNRLALKAGANACGATCQVLASSGAADARAEISKPSASIARNDQASRLRLKRPNFCPSTNSSMRSVCCNAPPARQFRAILLRRTRAAGSLAAVARNESLMLKFLTRRLLLSLITLGILSVVVFLGGQLLPGDVGRAVLGPLADARAVAVFDHQVGVDRPLWTQYWDWITHFVAGDMGRSFTFRAPVAPFVGEALANSVKLGALAFVLVVPLGIAGGVWAAMRAGRFGDRVLVLLGQSLGVVPEFISSIVLILVLGVWLRWLPMSADWPEDTPPLAQIRYLILPALPLVLVFFGYVARVARVGTIEAIDADYTRTAVLKGLSTGAVMRRHVLRNSLLPTITVTASLLGYLAGGLVVIETMFHYRGIGALIYTAARAKDFPMLEAGVLTVGAVYAVASVAADLLSAALNPRLRTAA